MTPEQIDRTIQFLLDHQGRLTANVEKHDEAIIALERNAARHDRDIQQLTDLIGRLATAETNLVGRMDALAQAQRETTERLNAFIAFVEKYISQHNGSE